MCCSNPYHRHYRGSQGEMEAQWTLMSCVPWQGFDPGAGTRPRRTCNAFRFNAYMDKTSRSVWLGTAVMKAARQEGQDLEGMHVMQSRHSACPHASDIGRRSVLGLKW